MWCFVIIPLPNTAEFHAQPGYMLTFSDKYGIKRFFCDNISNGGAFLDYGVQCKIF
jgi:hypothetical protein